jgi:ribokinase
MSRLRYRKHGSKSMSHVTVVGSINIDHTVFVSKWPEVGETIVAIEYLENSGGKGANQALAVARAGSTVSLVGAVGTDGSSALTHLAAAGVDVSLVTTSTRPTGTAHITVGPEGDNMIVVASGANHDVVVPIRISGIALAQLEIPIEAVSQVAERCDRFILNASPIREIPATILAIADPLLVNETEAAAIDLSIPRSVVITLGAGGAEVRDDRGVRNFAAPDVDVVDTTGAGDAFAGALAAALAAGADLDTATKAGIAAGSAAVQHKGAQPSAS